MKWVAAEGEKPKQHNAVLKKTQRLKRASGPTVCLNKQAKLRADRSQRAGKQQYSKQIHTEAPLQSKTIQITALQRCLLDSSAHELARADNFYSQES